MRHHKTRLAVAAAALTATAALVSPTTALAAPNGPERAAPDAPVTTPTPGLVRIWDPATRDSRNVPADRADRFVRDYWTPGRLAAAQPTRLPAGAADRRADPDHGRETVLAEPAQALEDSGMHIESDAWFSYTNGKLYFTKSGGSTHYCSGSAINSGRKRLVLTAGHCVYSRPGGWVSNWYFIPGYNRGDRPRGTFTMYQPWASTGWTRDGDYNRDFAFVITNRNANGQRVVDAVGGHGLIVNPGRPYVHVFGHPSNRTDGSQVQWYCWGTTHRVSVFDSRQELGCNFGGGASGGPWLENYSSNGLGSAISNTSTITSGGDNRGPYYDDHTADVYRAAENASP